MSSILTSQKPIEYKHGEFPEPEAYTLNRSKVLILSECLDYILYDSTSGNVDAQGKFPEDLPQDALPINAPYTYW